MSHEYSRAPAAGAGARAGRLESRLTLAFAVTLFLVLALDAARRETPTVDEYAHVPVGAAVLVHGETALYAKNPPLLRVLLAAPVVGAGAMVPAVPADPTHGWAPWRYGEQFLEANRTRYLDFFFLARSVNVALTLALAAVVYAWAHTLFGARAAAFGTALLLLDPVVLGHGHLATLDVGTALAVAATLFTGMHVARAPGPLRLLALGVVLGAGLLAKFTLTLLIPLVPVFALAWRGRAIGRAGLDTVVVLVTALLVVNAGMGFRGSFTALGELNLVSTFMRGLQQHLPGALPVPLPLDYVLGWDAQKLDVELGEFGSYMLGAYAQEGFLGYNAVALAAKVPLPTLVLLVLAVLWARRTGVAARDWLALLLPAAWLLAAFTWLSALDIGIRYLLPLLPLMHIGLAALWSPAGGRLDARLWVGRLAVLLAAGSAVATHPAHLARFSWLVGGSANGHRTLADSNLDWGQDLYRLPEALRALGHDGLVHLLYYGHVDPTLYGIDYDVAPYRPGQGVYAVSVNFVLGLPYVTPSPGGGFVFVDRWRTDWLRNTEPSLRAGTIWIYDRRAGN